MTTERGEIARLGDVWGPKEAVWRWPRKRNRRRV